MLNKRTAIYAGTFDPLTRGHEDLIRRAVGLFDNVIIAIAASKAKHPFFSLEERVAMAREVLSPYPNAEVCSFDGLLMNFLHEKGGLSQEGRPVHIDCCLRLRFRQRIGDFHRLVRCLDDRSRQIVDGRKIWRIQIQILVKVIATVGAVVFLIGEGLISCHRFSAPSCIIV